MNIISFLRFYLCYLIFNIGGWVYFGYLLYYTNYITTDDCNNNTKDLTTVIKIFVGMSMGLTTINIKEATKNILDNPNENELTFKNLSSNIIMTILLLTLSGLNSLVIFGITSGMTDIRCSNSNSELGLKLSVYGVIWITFIEIFVIFLAILLFLGKIIVNAKLYLLCESCINIYKKYKERRIVIEGSIEPPITNNNTNQITIPIPITTFKEEHKILCSICYDSAITLLLEPCNHICICQLCYNSLVTNECPICKTKILTTRKIYFAHLDF